jgi:hypothetical protein
VCGAGHDDRLQGEVLYWREETTGALFYSPELWDLVHTYKARRGRRA